MEKPQLVPSLRCRITVLGYCSCLGSFCQNIQLGIKLDAPKLVSGPWQSEWLKASSDRVSPSPPWWPGSRCSGWWWPWGWPRPGSGSARQDSPRSPSATNRLSGTIIIHVYLETSRHEAQKLYHWGRICQKSFIVGRNVCWCQECQYPLYLLQINWPHQFMQ